jgi:hypothetical protein
MLGRLTLFSSKSSQDRKIPKLKHQIIYPIKYAGQSYHCNSVEGCLVGLQRISATENLKGRVNLKSQNPMTKTFAILGMALTHLPS